MKTFFLILISLVIAVFISACGIVTQTSAYKTISKKEAKEFDEKYGGVYVFNKKFWDEVLYIEQQRDKYRKSEEFENDKKIYNEMLKNKEKEIEKLLIKEYGEEGAKKDEVRDKKWKMLDAFKEQNPFPTDKKFPQVLSNGCKYGINTIYNNGGYVTFLYKPYVEYIKQYMGEELAEKFESEQRSKFSTPFLSIESYYTCDERLFKAIPISFHTTIYLYEEREWGLGGDEGAGFRIYTPKWEQSLGKNIFYFIDNSFVKSDEKLDYQLFY